MLDRGSTFVGREHELAWLAARLDRVVGGEPRAVVVTGEAGVGKSRLVGEFMRRAQEAGTRVLSGGCVQLSGGGLPYGPLIDLLDRLADGDDAGVIAEPVGEAARLRLFQQVARLVDRLAAEQPLILVVEDAHWVDRSTVDLLVFLLRRSRRERLLVVLTCRSGEPHRCAELRTALAELERARRVERLEVSPFDRAGTADLAAALLAGRPPAELVDRVHARSGGNAFYAEELLAAGTDAELPRSVREAVLSRLYTLSADAVAVVRLAAVAGRIDHPVLAAATAVPEQGLLQALREATDRDLLVPSGSGYAFRHALARDAVYGDLLPGERMRLHGRLALALTASGSRPGATGLAELAHHWVEAGDAAAALPACVAAGQAAAGVQAAAEACRQFERALELWDRVPEPKAVASLGHADLCLLAAEAARWSGEIDRAVGLVRLGRERLHAGESPALTAALDERLGQYLWVSGDSAGSLAAYESAGRQLAGLPPLPETARVLAQQASALMLAGRYRASRLRCEQAIRAARAAGAEAEEGHARNTLGVDLVMSGEPEAGLGELSAARDIAERSGEREALCRAYANLTFALDNLGRLEEGLAEARRGMAALHQRGLGPASSGVLSANLASLLVRTGHWQEAATFLAEALDGSLPGGFSSLLHVLRGGLETGRGEFDSAAESFAAAQRDAVACDDPQINIALHVELAELALWRDEPDAAWTHVVKGLELCADAEETLLEARLCAAGAQAAARLVSARGAAGRRVARLAANSDGRAPAEAARVAGGGGGLAVIRATEMAKDSGGPVAEAARVGRSGGDGPAEVERARLAGQGGGPVAEAAPVGRSGGDGPAEAGAALLARALRLAAGEGAESTLPEVELAARTCEAEVEPGSPTARAQRWAAVTRGWEALARPYPAACARWRRAEALLEAGERDAALAELGTAHATALALGAAPLRFEVEALARRARLRLAPPATSEPRRPGPHDRFRLTTREREVLALLLDGATNRRIARALFITEKTASVHVSNIMAKIGATSRGEAVALAHRYRLADDHPRTARKQEAG